MRQVMLRCAELNSRYMRELVGYPAVAKVYERIAVSSVRCARAFAERSPRPEVVEPATAAFWWGVVDWAENFGPALLRHVGRSHVSSEFYEGFVEPHREFARWLRPLDEETERRLVTGYPSVREGWTLTAGQLILHHDAAWTSTVVWLTARWGLLHHLGNVRAAWQSFFLSRRLQRWPDPVARAHLEADLRFLGELFGYFPLSADLALAIRTFLAEARRDLQEPILRGG